MTLKLNMRSPVGTFQIEGQTQMEVFEAIATIQEVFSEDRCGLCGCEDLKYVVRTVEKFKFPELHCLNIACQARLSFGQNQEPLKGSLFPIRKLMDKTCQPNRKKGKYGKHNGWTKYKGDNDKEFDKDE
jgi:hypothetical protein